MKFTLEKPVIDGDGGSGGRGNAPRYGARDGACGAHDDGYDGGQEGASGYAQGGAIGHARESAWGCAGGEIDGADRGFGVAGRTDVTGGGKHEFENRTGRGNGNARSGTLETAHATMETPYFQPVATAGAIKGVTWDGIRRLGYPHVLMNTYHLVLRPGVERLAECGGMRAFSGWDGGILTDSGGYQVFSLAKLRKIEDDGVSFMSHIDGSMHRLTPESVVDAQLVFGSDIAMPLDVCSAHDADFGTAERELAVTAKWLREAAEVWHGRGGSGTGTELFGIVQGALYGELRERAAREAATLELPGYAVGGLSVGESDADFVRLAKHCAPLLPENKPRYLMGVGRPADIIRAIGWGYDLFDCVLPTRMARHNVAYTRYGQLDLRKARYAADDTPLDPGCECPVCMAHTRAYIYHLAKLHEMNAPILLTTHNLFFYRETVAAARAAILKCEYRAFAHAWLTRMGEWHPEWDGD